jgi:hypothetical protein
VDAQQSAPDQAGSRRRVAHVQENLFRFGALQAGVVPDTSRRKELFRPTGGPGALLVDGDVAGTWRARSTRKALSVSVDPWHRLADHKWDALRLEAERLAEARNAAAAHVNRLD